MVFVSLIASVLLATAALAFPSSAIKSRADIRRRSEPLQLVQGSNTAVDGTAPQVLYSSNWAGSAWNKTNGTFTSVTGTFKVPTPSAPNGYSSAWVGIDGFTCQNAILQTGIVLNLVNGVVSYDAWYEWFPAYAQPFDKPIVINSGDEIRLTVVATSSTTGEATIDNLSNAQSVTQEISSTYELCGANAEWIVEDFSSNNHLVPFNDFTTVTFEEAFAVATDGGYYDTGLYTPEDATTILLVQNKEIITSVDEGLLEVTIKYNATTSQ
ncbi:peptidase A4 family-domain-containing protein [Amanita rubescens]|nr:peptidase A4 family-domain-containing protein [Amanita rubescens]